MSVATMAPERRRTETSGATGAPGQIADGQLLLFVPTPQLVPTPQPGPPRRPAAPARRRRRGPGQTAPCRQAVPVRVARPLPGRAAAAQLTARGRMVLVGVAVAVLVGIALISHSSPQRDLGSTPSGGSVLVQPGETLWDVASRAEPQRDPGMAVADLEQRNDLRTVVVHPGQRLVLPAR